MLKEYQLKIDIRSIIVKIDPKGSSILSANDNFYNYLGYDQFDLENSSKKSLLKKLSTDLNLKDIKSSIKNRSVWYGDIKLLNNQKNTISTKAGIFPILNRDKEIKELIAIMYI
jgi:hypothetical protein